MQSSTTTAKVDPGQQTVGILAMAVELPPYSRSSEEVEDLIAAASPNYQPHRGIVQALTGIRNRRVAADDVQSSDLAASAALKVLTDASVQPDDVDALIFAAAGQDLIEPATANIVQEKIGTRCQVFDIKNACNSFLNGIQVAEALILSRACETVMVACGEVCSRSICWPVRDHHDFRQQLPGYTMGDAGAAALLSRSSNNRGIFYRRFSTISKHWSLATIPYGGSMHPRGDQFAYLRGDGAALRKTFVTLGPDVLKNIMSETGLSFDYFKRIFAHQVTVPYMRDMINATAMPENLIEQTVVEFGNVAAASIPLGFVEALSRGAISPGDRVLCLGMASGISIGVLMFDV